MILFVVQLDAKLGEAFRTARHKILRVANIPPEGSMQDTQHPRVRHRHMMPAAMGHEAE